MLTKSVKSVISVVLKHVAQAKKSVLSVRSVSDCNILLSGKTPKHKKVSRATWSLPYFVIRFYANKSSAAMYS